jgi:enolase
MEIKHIDARYILDSRGNPTVEADVWLTSGVFGRASVPSGASTGAHEAHELRDGGKPFGGKGVQKAIDNIQYEILPVLRGMRADDQFAIDARMIELDGTTNKSRLGANAILAVSLATAHAAAKARGILLYLHVNDIAGNPQKSIPMPMMNILNGGQHAAGSTDIQETMIVPVGAHSYHDAIRMGVEIFQELKNVLRDTGYTTTVGDEGGFAPAVRGGNVEALELALQATKQATYEAQKDIAIALDVAASELFANGQYSFASEKTARSTTELIAWYKKLLAEYPIVSIEDGLAEDDWEGWTELTKQLAGIQLVGDDLLVTNTDRLREAIQMKAGNAILIKPNQIGTLTETIKAVGLAKENRWNTILSHRSGETEDISITHIAVGTGAGQIKTGSLSRSDRNAKHNELLRLESIDPTIPFSNPFAA